MEPSVERALAVTSAASEGAEEVDREKPPGRQFVST